VAAQNGRPMLETKEIVSDEKDKPVLNEEILAKLLEAAWVLQEHNRAQQKVDLNLELHSEQLREREQASHGSASAPTNAFAEKETSSSTSVSEDYTSTLAKIVETQHQIQLRRLDLESSLEMVIERLIDITKASGAGVALLDGKKVRYPAAFGVGALTSDAEVEKERALCFDCLRTGQVTRCPDVISDFLLDVEECRRRGIQSLIAVPVYHEGGVTGALEVYFASANAFRETDVHSCQLMAGLVTEALARDEELTWKKSLAEERSVMLDALEKIKPNLAALVGEAGTGTAPARAASAESSICGSCGTEFVAGEQYCGTCGSPRARADSDVSMQTKLGSFLSTQPEQQKAHDQISDYQPHDHFAPRMQPSSQATAAATSPKESKSAAQPFDELTIAKPDVEDPAKGLEPAGGSVLATTEDTATWTSAAKAKDFLEQLAADQRESSFGRFWQARRGDIYLAVAVILVATVIRWGIWSEHSVSAVGTPTATGSTHPRQPDPNADLSLFDKMLISMGLADPPEVPENKGNPDTQVWVDLHTALYYCPGADLYGKTPKGRYASQRDAQLDQFEPAYRKTCD
jgi:GAF domain-containing protein